MLRFGVKQEKNKISSMNKYIFSLGFTNSKFLSSWISKVITYTTTYPYTFSNFTLPSRNFSDNTHHYPPRIPLPLLYAFHRRDESSGLKNYINNKRNKKLWEEHMSWRMTFYLLHSYYNLLRAHVNVLQTRDNNYVSLSHL